MSEESRKVRVKFYGMTQARIDYEPVVIDIPAEFADDDLIYDYIASMVEQNEIDTSVLEEVGSQMFDDKNLEFGYDVELV